MGGGQKPRHKKSNAGIPIDKNILKYNKDHLELRTHSCRKLQKNAIPQKFSFFLTGYSEICLGIARHVHASEFIQIHLDDIKIM